MSDKEITDYLLSLRLRKEDIRDVDDLISGYRITIAEQAEQIAELEEKLKAHEWVSVDDRLPEDGRCLLAVWCDGEYKAYADYEFPRFLSHVDSLYVTHWKPLTPPADKG